MIATELITTANGARAYDAHVCCPCRATLRFVRAGDTTECIVPVQPQPGADRDDLVVWTTLKTPACGCLDRVDRWRYAPAIPEPRRRTRAELERRAIRWQQRRQPHLSAWAVTTAARWAADTAKTPLHALAWTLLGADDRITVARYIAAGASTVLDQLEWARAGARTPTAVAAWLSAGALDAHDAACRTRAGQTPSTIDTSRSGCRALADAWPDTRPATTECARRLGIASGPAITRLTVALPTGGAIELYESTRHDEPVLAAVTVDAAGQEAAVTRVIIPRPPVTLAETREDRR